MIEDIQGAPRSTHLQIAGSHSGTEEIDVVTKPWQGPATHRRGIGTRGNHRRGKRGLPVRPVPEWSGERTATTLDAKPIAVMRSA